MRLLSTLLLVVGTTSSALAGVSSSGAFETNVSLVVPPFHGLEPKLALVYGSQSGDGPFGVGWALSGQSMIRRTGLGHGAPAFDINDVYELDGLELVQCNMSVTSPSCSYPESASQVAYAARIETWSRIAFDPSGNAWYVWTKNGVKRTYRPGLTTSQGVSEWNLAEVRDTLGNTVTYSYWTDTSPVGLGVQYLDTITYNSVVVRFYRELRPDSTTWAAGASSVATRRQRVRTIDVTVSGARARVYELVYDKGNDRRSMLASINLYGNDALVDALGRITNRTTAASVNLGSFERVAQTTSASWSEDSKHVSRVGTLDVPHSHSTQTGWPEPDYHPALGWRQQCFPMDVDGDGRQDFVCVTAHAPHGVTNFTHILLETAFFRDGAWRTVETDTLHTWSANLMPGDIDGDGRADLIEWEVHHSCDAVSPTACTHIALGGWMSKGDGTFARAFTRDTDWPYKVGTDRPANVFMGDVDGDGRTDVMAALHREVTGPPGTPTAFGVLRAARSTGSDFDLSIPATDVDWTVGYLANSFYPGDFDGDGRTDFIGITMHLLHAGSAFDHAMLRSARSTGNGFSVSPDLDLTGFEWRCAVCTAVGWGVMTQIALQGRLQHLLPTDANADGLTDVVILAATVNTGPTGDPTILGTTTILSNGNGTWTPLAEQTFANVPWGGVDSEPEPAGKVMIGLGPVSATIPHGPWRFQHLGTEMFGPDVNGDGIGDLLLAQVNNFTGNSGKVELITLAGAGDGTFKSARFHDSNWVVDLNSYQFSFAAGDVDGDQVGDFFWFHPHPGGTEIGVTRFPNTGERTTDWRSAEVTGDGRVDQIHIESGHDRPWAPGIGVMTLIGTASGGWNREWSTSSLTPLAPGAPSDTRKKLIALKTPDTHNWKVMDVNGDGRHDLVYVDHWFDATAMPSQGLRIFTLFSDGLGEFTATYFDLPGATTVDTPSFSSGDIDGDGREDLVHIKHLAPGYEISVLRSQGNGNWSPSATTITPPGLDEPDVRRWRLMDVNGDGRNDLVYVKQLTTGVQVTTLRATTTSTGPTWVGEFQRTLFAGESFLDPFRFMPADVNGDGMADLVHVHKTGNQLEVRALVSMGSSVPQPPGVSRVQFLERSTSSTTTALLLPDPSSWRVMDTNGDGRSDLVQVGDTKILTMVANYDGTFAAPRVDPHTARGTRFERRGWIAADIGGVGRPSIVYVANDASAPKDVEIVAVRAESIHDLLARVVGALGGITSVSYAMSGDMQGSGGNCGLPAGASVRVATRVASDDGRSGLDSADYTYTCARWSPRLRGLLGFDWVNLDQSAAPNRPARKVRTRYDVSDACMSRAADNQLQDSIGQAMSRTITAYLATGSQAPYRCERQYVDQLECTPGATCQNVFTFYGYDNFGNVSDVWEYGDTMTTGDERLTITSHNPNTGPWLVGVPAFTARYEGLAATGPAKRLTRFCYDGDNAACTGLATTGELTTILYWNDKKGVYHPINLDYDAYGNMWNVFDSNFHGSPRFFDSTYHVYETRRCNTLMQCTRTEWDMVRGLATKVTDINGKDTVYHYDPLGRVTSVDYPSGAIATREYSNVGNPTLQRVVSTISDRTADGLWRRDFLDGFGRTYRTEKEGDLPTTSYVQEVTYGDASGLPWRVSRPHANGVTPVYETLAYDALGRPTTATHADGSSSTWEYGADDSRTWMIKRDEEGHRRVTLEDAYRRIVGVVEYDEEADWNCTSIAGPWCPTDWATGTTKYRYDANDQLTELVDPAGNVTSASMDSLGRLLVSTDPDMGAWTFTYDAVGNLLTRTDANGVTLSFQYDLIDRPIKKLYPSGDTVEWHYDQAGHGASIGRLTSVTDPTAVGCANDIGEDLTYDASGQVTSRMKCIYGRDYTFGFSFDALDRLATITYPDGEIVDHAYDASGKLARVGGYAARLDHDAAGRLELAAFGNNTVSRWGYDPQRGWLDWAEVVRGKQQLYRADYQQDLDGTITSITSPTHQMNLAFTYDDLHRLTETTGDYKQALTYDQLGRITSNTDHAAYSYTSGKPHAVTSTSVETFTYDPAGNMTSRKCAYYWCTARGLTWTQDNQPETIIGLTGQATYYQYDAFGKRVQKYQTSTGTTRYYGPLAEYSFTTGLTQYYYAGDLLIARKDSSGAVTWLHGDHLKSTRMVTDTKGLAVETYTYQPFGRKSSWSGATDIQFTGQRIDEDTGLIYLGARYYDPWIGRFISGDTHVPSVFSPQTLDRYAYALNNPVSNVDPSGHASFEYSRPDGSNYELEWSDVSAAKAWAGPEGSERGQMYSLGHRLVGEASASFQAASWSVPGNTTLEVVAPTPPPVKLDDRPPPHKPTPPAARPWHRPSTPSPQPIVPTDEIKPTDTQKPPVPGGDTLKYVLTEIMPVIAEWTGYVGLGCTLVPVCGPYGKVADAVSLVAELANIAGTAYYDSLAGGGGKGARLGANKAVEKGVEHFLTKKWKIPKPLAEKFSALFGQLFDKALGDTIENGVKDGIGLTPIGDSPGADLMPGTP